jgi:hypothetical protein
MPIVLTHQQIASHKSSSSPCRGDRSIPRARLDKLFTDDGHDLRERVLWRMLYETAARAEELLARNIEDLDLEFRRGKRSRAAKVVRWSRLWLADPSIRPG